MFQTTNQHGFTPHLNVYRLRTNQNNIFVNLFHQDQWARAKASAA